MRFKILYSAFLLFLTACAVVQPIDSPRSTTPSPTPGGYVQFCADFPKSPLCKQE